MVPPNVAGEKQSVEQIEDPQGHMASCAKRDALKVTFVYA